MANSTSGLGDQTILEPSSGPSSYDSSKQTQYAKDALDQAAEAAKYLDTPIDPGITGGAEYQYSDWMNNWYLRGKDGKEYVFIPDSFVNKGQVQDIPDLQGNVKSRQFYNPVFLKSETFKDASPYSMWDTNGYVWEVDDAINNGILRGAGDPSLKSYTIDANNPALAGIGKPTYAPGEYQSQICYVSQPKQIDSSHAQQNFVSGNDGQRYTGSLGYEYVHQGSFWNAVRKVLPTINMLAPVLLDVFVAPGTGAAFGIGSSVGTGIATGNFEQGLINAAKLYAIQQGSSAIGNMAGQEFSNFGDLAKSIVQTGTANAVTASLLGRDPVQGFISGGIAGAVGSASKSIEGFGDLPVPVQKMFAAGMGSALQGKTPDQINQAVMTAAVRSGLEAMGNAMDASKYFEEKVGRPPSTDELNNFTWYTNRNALQTSLDNYAKISTQAEASGVPLTTEQIRECLSSTNPVEKATQYIQETKQAQQPVATTPEPTPAPTPEPTPAPTPAPSPAPAQTPEQPTAQSVETGTSPTVGGIDMSQFPVQDLGVSPQDWESFQQTLADEGFIPSQWKTNDEGGYTIIGDDGSTLTINADGSTSFTEATDTTYTGPARQAPGIKLTPGVPAKTGETTPGTTTPGAETPAQAKPKLSQDDVMSLLAMISGEDFNYQPQQQPTQQKAGPTGAQVKVGGGQGSEINYLDELGEKPSYLDTLEQEQPTEGGEVQPGQDAGAITRGETPPPGREKNIGGGAGYGTGYTSKGPVVKGGNVYGSYPGTTTAQEGEMTMDQIVAMLRSQSGQGEYGSQKDAETARLIRDMQAAGLQDQSDAETQRLANAYGPVAVGKVPVTRPMANLPATVAAPAKVADINTLPSGSQVDQPPQAAGLAALSNVGPSAIQQLQSYIADQRKFGATEEQLSQLKSQLLNMLAGTRQTKQQGTTAYKDMFGNIRTY